MIISFRSKALAAYWDKGDTRKMPVQNVARVRRLLLALDAASEPKDMNLPGLKFHELHPPGRWAIWVTGNYRITWAWEAGAIDIDLEDYH